MIYNLDTVRDDLILDIGIQGEDNARQVKFDISAWLAAWPGGTIEIQYKRPEDTGAYDALPSKFSVVDGILTWIIDINQTVYGGYGYAIITYRQGGVVRKSPRFNTLVKAGLPPAGPAPDTVADWIAEANTALNAIETLEFTINEDGELLAGETVLGRVSDNPRGNYNPDADPLYSKRDIVFDNGGSYRYINDTPSNEPTSSTSHWQQIASIGGQDLVDAAVAARNAAQAQAVLAQGYAAQLAAGTASPAGTYANLSALNTDDPDNSKIYITLDDGNWCYHNGTAFVAGGVYQAASVAAEVSSLNQALIYADVNGTKEYELTGFVNKSVNEISGQQSVDMETRVSNTDAFPISELTEKLDIKYDTSVISGRIWFFDDTDTVIGSYSSLTGNDEITNLTGKKSFRLLFYDTTSSSSNLSVLTVTGSLKITQKRIVPHNVELIFNKQNVTLDGGPDIAGECSIVKVAGKVIMIDTAGAVRATATQDFLARYGIKHVDYLILTHYHEDHAANFYGFMKTYLNWTGSKVYLPLPAADYLELPGIDISEHEEVADVLQCCSDLGITPIYPVEGDILQIGDGFKIRFWNCGNTALTDMTNNYLPMYKKDLYSINSYSMVIEMLHGNKTYINGGDATCGALYRLKDIGAFENVDVYKVTHHNAESGATAVPQFFKVVNPKISVLVGLRVAHYAGAEWAFYGNGEKYVAWDRDVRLICNGLDDVVVTSGESISPALRFQTVFFYVNSSVSSSSVQDGSSKHKFKSINDAISYGRQFAQSGRPIHIRLQLDPGTFNEFVRVDGYAGKISIYGGSTRSGYTINGLWFRNCGDVYLYGFTAKANNSLNACVGAWGNTSLICESCKLIEDSGFVVPTYHHNDTVEDDENTAIIYGYGASNGATIKSVDTVFDGVDAAIGAVYGGTVAVKSINVASQNISQFAHILQGTVITANDLDTSFINGICVKTGTLTPQFKEVNAVVL